MLDWEGIPVYPGVTDGFGNDVLAAYAFHHFRGDRNAGWIVLLQDAWTIRSEKLKDYHVAAWAPVDHSPCPPRVVKFFERNGAVPIAQSKHGFRMFEQAGLHPMLVPHGIDTDLFRPSGKAAREAMGLPADAFVFGMVAQNTGTSPPRKAFPEVFCAFKTIHDRHPDTMLYLHSVESKIHNGLDLKRLAEMCGVPSDALMFTDQFAYVAGLNKTEDMPAIYSAFDVLVNPAYGEGFGMPIIEAQACGVPVILADNTAMPELLGGGWLVPSYPQWDEEQASWWGRVHVPELTEVMEEAYGASDRRKIEARAFVVEHYDLEHIMADYWKPALDELAGMLEAPKASPVDLSKL